MIESRRKISSSNLTFTGIIWFLKSLKLRQALQHNFCPKCESSKLFESFFQINSTQWISKVDGQKFRLETIQNAWPTMSKNERSRSLQLAFETVGSSILGQSDHFCLRPSTLMWIVVHFRLKTAHLNGCLYSNLQTIHPFLNWPSSKFMSSDPHCKWLHFYSIYF